MRPVLFLISADFVHHAFLNTGRGLGRFYLFRFIFYKIFCFKNKKLEQNISGTVFSNPISLAAGFDYNADLIEILPCIGFGSHTIGTITLLPYGGNKGGMLARLPKSKSLLVNKGFKNEGIEYILNKSKKYRKSIPLGLSIGSTNMDYASFEEMVDDIYKTFELSLSENHFDYFELNISCPNLINAMSLSDKLDTPLGLRLLLIKLSILNISIPVFIKMPLEKNEEDTLSLLNVAEEFKFIKGLIFSNLAKKRDNPRFNKNEIEKAKEGNFSGKPTEDLSNSLISLAYRHYKDRFIIIGCGGVFSGHDAYEKIKRGATLVQLITGMIYEGPSQIGNINKDLVKLLEKDGYKSIGEAIGTYK